MGNQKKYPISDDAREAALSTAKKHKDEVGADENVFSQAISDKLDAEEPQFIAIRKTQNEAEKAERKAVDEFAPQLQDLKNRTSHGLQLINFKIIDHDAGFTPDIRSLYNMDSEGHLPSMNSEDEVIQAANDFITGETSRVAQGGVGLTDISKASVQALLGSVLEKREEKRLASIALGLANHNLMDERVIVDDLIKSMWDEIEFAAKDMIPSEYHDFCVAWGMVFEHTPGTATVNAKAEDTDSGQALVGVDIRIGKPDGTGGAKAKTNNFGVVSLTTSNFQPTHIIAELPLYDRLIQEITVSEGQTISLVLKMKKSAG